MLCSDIVDKLLYEYGLPDAGSSEQSDLSSLRVGRQKIDDLYTCFQYLIGMAALGI